MSAMAQLSRGALSARPFAPLPKPASARSVHLKAAGSEQLWLPGTERPSHLNGDLPGDRGFDPLVSFFLTFVRHRKSVERRQVISVAVQALIPIRCPSILISAYLCCRVWDLSPTG